jgi:xanthine dehydrogenase small subunit
MLTLLDFLRARGLTVQREGCAEGECGACTVVMVADDRGRATYRAINSCLVLLRTIAGHEIYTVESLAASGTLADAQQAMAAAGGSQCGYCTPGFVMSLFAEHYRPDRTGPCDPHAMAGNLCRCTGYRPIRDAALALGPCAR